MNSFPFRLRPLPLKRVATYCTKIMLESWSPDALEKSVLATLRNDIKVLPGSKILLCVSGGVDSMAMLHILSKVRHEFNPSLELEVITFNHKLRSESDEETNFVTRTATYYGLKTHVRILDEHLRVEHGLQATARRWRRKECLQLLSSWSNIPRPNEQQPDSATQLLQNNLNLSPSSSSTPSQAASIGVKQSLNPKAYVATGHHSGDQIETILLKLVRGVHLSHFVPMLPLSNCQRFIKPLLALQKSELIKYMEYNNHMWREDISNESIKYKRFLYFHMFAMADALFMCFVTCLECSSYFL